MNHPALVTIFDGGNIVCQGYSTDECFEQYLAMKPSIGWMHIKDYRDPQLAGHGAARRRGQAEALRAGRLGRQRPRANPPRLCRGDSAAGAEAHERGIPGVILDLEPHLKGGGQFGGFSGPDGMGVAVRGLCRVLDYVGIDYHLRDFDDVRAARGF